MNVSKFMMLFHLSFLSVGLSSLFLMIIDVISLDWSAFWIIVVAVLLNAFFGVLWIDEAIRRRAGRAEKPEAAPLFRRVFPMVSFVVPAYNDEQDIPQRVNSLFKCAERYRGPSEIIIVDDGSTDNTFATAWATIDSMRREFVQTRATVVRYTARLGKDEAVRAGVNKAMGEYIFIVDALVVCDPEWFNNLVDYTSATGKIAVNQVHPSRGTVPIMPSAVRLYRADVLRHQLNQNQVKDIIKR